MDSRGPSTIVVRTVPLTEHGDAVGGTRMIAGRSDCDSPERVAGPRRRAEDAVTRAWENAGRIAYISASVTSTMARA